VQAVIPADGFGRNGRTGTVVQRAADRRGVHLLVLIDALGWEYIKNREFLDELLPYRRPLRTVLGFSSGAIPTILTGAWPSVTGHWNLFYYDPKGSPFRWLKYLSFLPDFVLNHRITTKVLKEMGRHILGLGPSFECSVNSSELRWFNFVEKKNIYASGGISGAKSIFDYMKQENIPHRIYTYHDATDAEIVEIAERDIRTKAGQFYFVYLSEMDMFLHMHCSDEKLLDERIALYGRRLKRLYERAQEIDPGAIMTVLSDHGMTPVRNYYDLMKDVEEAGYKIRKDYLAVYDSTMARFWFFNESTRSGITSLLAKSERGRILSDEELEALGVFFDDRRFGEIVFLLPPGWIFSKSNFNGPQWRPVGMHGYHPDDSYSDGIFLSTHVPEKEIRSIADVYPWMLKVGAQ